MHMSQGVPGMCMRKEIKGQDSNQETYFTDREGACREFQVGERKTKGI